MKKVLTCEVPLLTPTGKVLTPIQIVYDDATMFLAVAKQIEKELLK